MWGPNEYLWGAADLALCENALPVSLNHRFHCLVSMHNHEQGVEEGQGLRNVEQLFMITHFDRRLDRQTDDLKNYVKEYVGAVEGKLETKLGAVETNLETKLGAVETKLGALESNQIKLDTRVGALEVTLGAVQTNLSTLSVKVDALETKTEKSSETIIRGQAVLTALVLLSGVLGSILQNSPLVKGFWDSLPG